MSQLLEIKEIPRRLYAVGDIHGCSRELSVLLDCLRNEERLGVEDRVVFIGDYIDRGPDSRGVLQLLNEFREEFPGSIFLRGNHEDMLLDYLGFKGSQGLSYLANGGRGFLKSYGILASCRPVEVVNDLPNAHLAFLNSLERYALVGQYLFCHAGINPLLGLREQRDEDLFWIRDEFVMNIHRLDRTVVFGHTPYEDIFFNLPYKIGIDTGLVYKNLLSCIEVLHGEVIQVSYGKGNIIRSSYKDFGVDFR